MNIDCYALNSIGDAAKHYLLEYSDMGMGYLLNAAGGRRDATAPNSVIHGAATTILRMMKSDRLSNADVRRELANKYIQLDEIEQRAAQNLATKVWLHMCYKKI